MHFSCRISQMEFGIYENNENVKSPFLVMSPVDMNLDSKRSKICSRTGSLSCSTAKENEMSDAHRYILKLSNKFQKW